MVLFLHWSESGVLGVDEGGREGDDEILKKKSIKGNFIVDRDPILGIEERNCKSSLFLLRKSF